MRKFQRSLTYKDRLMYNLDTTGKDWVDVKLRMPTKEDGGPHDEILWRFPDGSHIVAGSGERYSDFVAWKRLDLELFVPFPELPKGYRYVCLQDDFSPKALYYSKSEARWIRTSNHLNINTWSSGLCYCVPTEEESSPAYVPLDLDGMYKVFHRTFKAKFNDNLYKVTRFGKDDVQLTLVNADYTVTLTYEDILEKFEFEDGSPCGTLVQ